MKKIIILAIAICFISCKREKTEKELVVELKTNIVTSQKKPDFEKKVYPVIKKLYETNKEKYSLINNINEKIKKEKNPEIAKYNMKDLKEELKYIK